MTLLNDLNVLIVDRSDYAGFDLRNAFVKAGANTHVVSNFASATKLLTNKKIDAVLVEFSTDPDTVMFCKMASELAVPCVFTCEPPPRYAAARKDKPQVVAAIQTILADHLEETA